ncbi:hypothetical protein PVAND_012803 [Polypedilum vanderplanki]|uniref:FAM192A/Fyv6 N-terminal domain-containing protein n=1 Tax=Polypedilum vanderplanki TaxID=319348 RepID=A0A9J6CMR5_POLVA|nr:hypothetical protein PVAND_012803 [Polypedilum vanderplanki]
MNFESEKDIKEQNEVHVEAWNQVCQTLKGNQNETEKEYDSRPLYQRLMERKEKDETKLKEANTMLIDQERASDIEFINEINKIQFMNAIHLMQNDKRAIEEFKVAVMQCKEDEYKALKDKSTKSMKLRNMNTTNKQKELISKAIKKGPRSSLKTIAVLPGIGNYELSDTSSSSTSSESDRDELDTIILPRPAKKQKDEAED